MDRKRGVYHQGVRRRSDPADRREVLARIVADIAIEARPDRQRAGISQQDGGAVGRAFRHRASSDRAAGAAAVVDDDRLAERLAHLVRDDPPDDGGAAAGRERDNERDRPVRIVLRGRGRRRHAGPGGERRRKQDVTQSAGHGHSCLSSPWTMSLLSYSGLMPTALTRSDHIVTSRSMMAAYSSGVVGCGSAPSTASRLRTSSVASAALSARFNLSMMARGVPAGAARPHRSGTS